MYTIGEFAERIGVAVHTVQRWDREGRLPARRTLSNRRYYTEEDVNTVLGQQQRSTAVHERPSRCVAYCRVSSQAQKPDLRHQRQALEQYCVARGLVVDEWITEIGGGLNFQRKQFLRVVDGILSDDIGTLVIAHKDRLARFGFDLLEHLCETHHCELLILNTESVSPEQEMVQDLMTIIHCFSSRLYGLRNYRKALKQALAAPNEPVDDARTLAASVPSGKESGAHG
jgi:predicted site-specific integrase-resolvase